jgi:hypothetical protein
MFCPFCRKPVDRIHVNRDALMYAATDYPGDSAEVFEYDILKFRCSADPEAHSFYVSREDLVKLGVSFDPDQA